MRGLFGQSKNAGRHENHYDIRAPLEGASLAKEGWLAGFAGWLAGWRSKRKGGGETSANHIATKLSPQQQQPLTNEEWRPIYCASCHQPSLPERADCCIYIYVYIMCNVCARGISAIQIGKKVLFWLARWQKRAIMIPRNQVFLSELHSENSRIFSLYRTNYEYAYICRCCPKAKNLK